GVIRLAHPRRGDPQTEEARVVSRELGIRDIHRGEVLLGELSQLGTGPTGGAASDGQDRGDAVVTQALPEHCLPHHPRGSKENDPHSFMQRLLIRAVKRGLAGSSGSRAQQLCYARAGDEARRRPPDRRLLLLSAGAVRRSTARAESAPLDALGPTPDRRGLAASPAG